MHADIMREIQSTIAAGQKFMPVRVDEADARYAETSPTGAGVRSYAAVGRPATAVGIRRAVIVR
jgi:hypothetical protein